MGLALQPTLKFPAKTRVHCELWFCAFLPNNSHILAFACLYYIHCSGFSLRITFLFKEILLFCLFLGCRKYFVRCGILQLHEASLFVKSSWPLFISNFHSWLLINNIIFSSAILYLILTNHQIIIAHILLHVSKLFKILIIIICINRSKSSRKPLSVIIVHDKH